MTATRSSSPSKTQRPNAGAARRRLLMVARNREHEIGCQVSLAAMIVVAIIVGLPPMVDVAAGALERFRTAKVSGVGLGCNICGIVEYVREVIPTVRTHEVSTVAGDGSLGIAVLLGALSGKMAVGSAKIYEVAVYMQDGSVRVLQSSTPPAWRPGDRVKVVMGRVKPAS